MTLRTRVIAKALLLPALVGIACIAAPTAAQADSSDCPSGYVCMWEDNKFQGEMYVRQPLNVGSYDIDGWDGDNEISSIYVNQSGTRKCVTLYNGDNWTGSTWKSDNWGDMLKRLDYAGDFDNKAESYKI